MLRFKCKKCSDTNLYMKRTEDSREYACNIRGGRFDATPLVQSVDARLRFYCGNGHIVNGKRWEPIADQQAMLAYLRKNSPEEATEAENGPPRGAVGTFLHACCRLSWWQMDELVARLRLRRGSYREDEVQIGEDAKRRRDERFNKYVTELAKLLWPED